MLRDLQYAAITFESFVNDVLMPGAFPLRAPLGVRVWQTQDHVAPQVAAGQKYAPVDLGWRWGPVWSTAWFALSGAVPAAMTGRRVALRFSSGTEALLWRDGVPFQGFDPNRDLAVLWERAPEGAPVELQVEAACNMPLGASTFWWDAPELRARWLEAQPGRLEAAELVVFDEQVWRFAQGFDGARRLVEMLPEGDARAHELDRGLRALMARLPNTQPALSAACMALFPELAALLMGRAAQTPVVCNAVGHAHIDTAWLWPIAETHRKCLRTFASVLRLQERFPRMHFLCSQAQQYAWVEQDSPELFEQIAARVAEGRWEPGGAMWIEPDCTCPSGESLVRQIVHGTAWWQSRFGDRAAQRFLYLPDTFGFPASLPQIMALAGLDTFITNKISWSETNRFPHVTFQWRGIDGTEVLSHLTPGHNYNSSILPKDLQFGAHNLVEQDKALIPMYLQPFGFGDGGGGPTAEQAERASIGARCEGLPRVEQESVSAFCEQLHRAKHELDARGKQMPVWDGELYLELHRGTYTTQAWIKRANVAAERALRTAEFAVTALALRTGAAVPAEAREQLDEAWKLVLLNQFHDILPGSSIAEVYRDARKDYARVDEIIAPLTRDALGELAGAAGVDGTSGGAVVNAASCEQSGWVETPRGAVWVEQAPGLGVCAGTAGTNSAHTRAAADKHAAVGAQSESRTLWNERAEFTIDEAGAIMTATLRADENGTARIANALDARDAPLPLNQLVIYKDCPRRWEAWDIDREYMEHARPVALPADRVSLERNDADCAEILVERTIGARSRIEQRYVVRRGSSRLDIHTRVDWHEERTLLRALFPTAVRARTATFGIQFGAFERSTHENTSWERAQFEVPGHGWMDLSEPGLGVAVLDDGKYGRSAKHGVLGLSLLRAPNFPDPDADRGTHEFTYSLLLHEGDWRTAGVDQEAERLANPLRWVEGAGAGAGAGSGAGAKSAAQSWSPARIRVERGSACMQVAALKPAEDGEGAILRMVEMHGAQGTVVIEWGFPVRAVQPVDLLERPMHLACAAHEGERNATVVRVRPHQIVSMRVLS